MGLTEYMNKGIVGIVLLLIVVTVIGATATLVDDGAEDLTWDDRCTTAGCFYNATRGALAGNLTCTANNFTESDTVQCTADGTTGAYPLETLFNTGGIVILAFLGAGFILVIGVAFKMWKSKN